MERFLIFGSIPVEESSTSLRVHKLSYTNTRLLKGYTRPMHMMTLASHLGGASGPPLGRSDISPVQQLGESILLSRNFPDNFNKNRIGGLLGLQTLRPHNGSLTIYALAHASDTHVNCLLQSRAWFHASVSCADTQLEGSTE